MPTISNFGALVVAAIACVCDLKSRRIPNALTMSAAGTALVVQLVSAGWHGVALSTFGLFVGLAIFFPLFMLRGMGAGDVKLLAALGAWLGPADVVRTALYGVIAGGIMALVVALYSRYLFRALSNLWGLLLYWAAVGVQPMPALTLADARGPRLAYAIPISVGAVVTVWLRS